MLVSDENVRVFTHKKEYGVRKLAGVGSMSNLIFSQDMAAFNVDVENFA